MDERYIELKLLCPRCRYEYTLRVLRIPQTDRCPNCGCMINRLEIVKKEIK